MASRIENLPVDILSLLTCFLKAPEINQLASTSRLLHNELFIKVVTEERNQLIENQKEANILYFQTTLEKERTFEGNTFHLQLLKFNITTKDQGWVRDSESGSWIEAEFQ